MDKNALTITINGRNWRGSRFVDEVDLAVLEKMIAMYLEHKQYAIFETRQAPDHIVYDYTVTVTRSSGGSA